MRAKEALEQVMELGLKSHMKYKKPHRFCHTRCLIRSLSLNRIDFPSLCIYHILAAFWHGRCHLIPLTNHPPPLTLKAICGGIQLLGISSIDS